MHICINCSCSKTSQVITLREFIKNLISNQSEIRQRNEHKMKSSKNVTKCIEWLCEDCGKYHTKNFKKNYSSNEKALKNYNVIKPIILMYSIVKYVVSTYVKVVSQVTFIIN